MTTISEQSNPNTAFNDVYKALSNPTRRQILHVVEEEDSCAVGELAAAVGQAAHSNHGRVFTDLHHLPLLDDANVVDWKRDANTVTTGSQFELAHEIIRELDGMGDLDP